MKPYGITWRNVPATKIQNRNTDQRYRGLKICTDGKFQNTLTKNWKTSWYVHDGKMRASERASERERERERKREREREREREFVCWLLNVPATCECISGTDLLRQFYVLPHWDRSCRSNLPSHPVTVYWHRANQSQRWPYNARRLAG